MASNTVYSSVNSTYRRMKQPQMVVDKETEKTPDVPMMDDNVQTIVNYLHSKFSVGRAMRAQIKSKVIDD